ncbi:antitoxin [Ornithinimicrobium flavum]|uniref:antitoxin n=1 Tax=Ornithinimicrobium flavum TaxID=1288636 RepID=UPI00106F74ED|nr:antitoxin [Ornithinimicrobium flavum]
MGFMDKAKDAMGQHQDAIDKAVDQHGDGVVERAGDMIDERTGDKYADHVDKGQDMARERLGTDGTPTEGEPRG